MRIDQNGEASVFYQGLGRRTGSPSTTKAFCTSPPLCEGGAASCVSTPDGRTREMFVAGMNVVGLAFSATGDMVVATNEAVYSLPLGIQRNIVEVVN